MKPNIHPSSLPSLFRSHCGKRLVFSSAKPLDSCNSIGDMCQIGRLVVRVGNGCLKLHLRPIVKGTCAFLMSRRMLTIMSFKLLLTVIKVRGPNGHDYSHATTRANLDPFCLFFLFVQRSCPKKSFIPFFDQNCTREV